LGSARPSSLPASHTVHWRLSKNYFEPPTLLAILRRQLSGKVPTPSARPALQT